MNAGWEIQQKSMGWLAGEDIAQERFRRLSFEGRAVQGQGSNPSLKLRGNAGAVAHWPRNQEFRVPRCLSLLPKSRAAI